MKPAVLLAAAVLLIGLNGCSVLSSVTGHAEAHEDDQNYKHCLAQNPNQPSRCNLAKELDQQDHSSSNDPH